MAKYELYLKPDKSKKIRNGQMWCPYCGDWTYFKYNQPMRSPLFKGMTNPYRACVKCGISVEDFYVKQVNNLW